MRKHRKRYSRPKKPWSKERLDSERGIASEYGLRRKGEIWKVEARLREFRRRAREIVASQNKTAEKELVDKIIGLGLIPKESHLDDVLALTVENLLDRRLQTIVFRKGIGSTQKQARQFITHGHISIDGRRVEWPSAFISLEQEEKIGIYGNSKLKDAIVKLKNANQKLKKQEAKKAEEKAAEAKPEENLEKSAEVIKSPVDAVADVVAKDVAVVKEKVEETVKEVVEEVKEGKTKEAAEKAVDHVENEVVEVASEVKEEMKKDAEEVKEKVAEVVAEVKEKVEEVAAEVKEKVEEVKKE